MQDHADNVLTDGCSLGWLNPAKPIFPRPELLLRREVDVVRIVLVTYLSLLLTVIATFRTFGFDLESAKEVYPYVANGWGIWYWLAQLRLNVYLFFLIINFVLSAQILTLAFPKNIARAQLTTSMAILAYLTLWSLFGQARYGMAIALIASSVVTGSLPVVLMMGLIASLLHKAVAGGVLLIVLWLWLRDKKHGLMIAAILSAALSCIVHFTSEFMLAITGYGFYQNWEALPSANTPLKYYYMIIVLIAWKITDRNSSNHILILTLLFLPFSYFIVFAGRSYVLYSVVLLAYLLRAEVPRFVRNLILLAYVGDIAMLLFKSGLYF